MTQYQTEQERFWASEFGDAYTTRNSSAALASANVAFFSALLGRTRGVSSVLELGANRGMNLAALRAIRPALDLAGVEINPSAAAILREQNLRTFECSLLDFTADERWDLVFTKGVLIHLAPDALPGVYDLMNRVSARYVLVAEYYNPTPVELGYRGHDGKLFKRDFAGELMDRHPSFELVDYGFLYHRDTNFPQDDITWFLLEKRRETTGQIR